MIRLILAAALISGLLQYVFGEQPARRTGNARRAHPKPRRTRPRRADISAVSR
jgi:hypothetical protein